MKYEDAVRITVKYAKSCREMEYTDEETSLFAEKYMFQVCDMAFLLASVAKCCNLSIDKLVSTLHTYSIRDIANGIIIAAM